MESQGFKIWRNPASGAEGPTYMGEFCPPEGRPCLYASDLSALGFAPGCYTVRVPDSFRDLYLLPPWQRVDVR